MLVIAFSVPTSMLSSAPTWDALRARAVATTTGARFAREEKLRADGLGPPHTAATLRRFDAPDNSAVRVTFYRDAAAWCPYCQKVWLLLEEKQIPYRVQHINLNAYGYKPAWYSRLVDGGKLPAVEIDGELLVESLSVARTLDAAFPGPCLVPAAGSDAARRESDLFELEQLLQRDWFSLVFYPVESAAALHARDTLLATLRKLDAALAATDGPWLLGGGVSLRSARCRAHTHDAYAYACAVSRREGAFALSLFHPPQSTRLSSICNSL
jgi:glutathione S-transferase